MLEKMMDRAFVYQYTIFVEHPSDVLTTLCFTNKSTDNVLQICEPTGGQKFFTE